MEMLPSAASFFFFSSFPTPLCIPVVPFSFSSRTNARFYPDKRDKKRGILVEKFLRRCESFWGRFFFIAGTLLVTNFELPFFHSNNKIVKRKE